MLQEKGSKKRSDFSFATSELMQNPTQALGAWSGLMGNISNITFLLLFLGLFVGGAYYATQLNSVIGEMKSDQAKATITKIQNTIL